MMSVFLGSNEEDRGEHGGTGRVRGDQQEDDVRELEPIHEAGGAPQQHLDAAEGQDLPQQPAGRRKEDVRGRGEGAAVPARQVPDDDDNDDDNDNNAGKFRTIEHEYDGVKEHFDDELQQKEEAAR